MGHSSRPSFERLAPVSDHYANLPVAEVKCRYKAPAKYDDMILIRTKIVNLRGYLIHFFYEILRDEDGALLAEGESVHIVVGPDMQKSPLPEKYMEPFMKAMGI